MYHIRVRQLMTDRFHISQQPKLQSDKESAEHTVRTDVRFPYGIYKWIRARHLVQQSPHAHKHTHTLCSVQFGAWDCWNQAKDNTGFLRNWAVWGLLLIALYRIRCTRNILWTMKHMALYFEFSSTSHSFGHGMEIAWFSWRWLSCLHVIKMLRFLDF